MFLTLLWVHVVFVFPYVMLSLGPSWRRFDTGFTDLAANLGAGPWRRFCAVKLPILLIPVLTAFAVGFAVSQALYLPTVFASNGRIATLTTEAVILASGASRQTLGAASFLQMALPLVVFLAADLAGLARFRRFSWFRV
jgi:putative thiamine transport system permease protein